MFHHQTDPPLLGPLLVAEWTILLLTIILLQNKSIIAYRHQKNPPILGLPLSQASPFRGPPTGGLNFPSI